ncbi:MAG: hypothetical protein DRH90_21415, partial [Deltaproteobacteria bacterium]
MKTETESSTGGIHTQADGPGSMFGYQERGDAARGLMSPTALYNQHPMGGFMNGIMGTIMNGNNARPPTGGGGGGQPVAPPTELPQNAYQGPANQYDPESRWFRNNDGNIVEDKYGM